MPINNDTVLATAIGEQERQTENNIADAAVKVQEQTQKIQAKAQRMRRYEKRKEFFRQNKIFKEDGKKFYRELIKKKIEVNEPPTIEEVEEFWSTIW